MPNEDSTGVRRLNHAGTALVAKLSLGALALNDIWFGGQSMNPRLPLDDWSGSSAGPATATATATGLIAFAMGGETRGSLISRCVLCGTSGLHPTCCRVSRAGAMTLCRTMDKLGTIARSVKDTMLVLHAISGADAGDVASVPTRAKVAIASVMQPAPAYLPASVR